MINLLVLPGILVSAILGAIVVPRYIVYGSWPRQGFELDGLGYQAIGLGIGVGVWLIAWTVTFFGPRAVWIAILAVSLLAPSLDCCEAKRQRLPEPTAEQQREQTAVALPASLTHLRQVEAAFWERGWRSAHHGSGIHPENHLWDAVRGDLGLLDAVGARCPGADSYVSQRVSGMPVHSATGRAPGQ